MYLNLETNFHHMQRMDAFHYMSMQMQIYTQQDLASLSTNSHPLQIQHYVFALSVGFYIPWKKILQYNLIQ